MPNICSKYSETLGKYFKEQQRANNFLAETFDISGKVDTQHFVYKLNEEAIPKEARKMGLIVEGKIKLDNGEWWKIDVPKEMATKPVTAFGKTFASPLIIGAGLIGTAVAIPPAYKAIKGLVNKKENNK